MSAPPREFELDAGDGRTLKFQVSRLKVKASLAGLRLVGKVLLPALGEAAGAPAGQLGAAISRAVEGLDCLPELTDLFAVVTKVPSPTNPDAWVGLSPFIEDVFGGRPDLVLDYLVNCCQAEYGNFWRGDGQVAQMLRAATTKAGSTSPTT